MNNNGHQSDMCWSSPDSSYCSQTTSASANTFDNNHSHPNHDYVAYHHHDRFLFNAQNLSIDRFPVPAPPSEYLASINSTTNTMPMSSQYYSQFNDSVMDATRLPSNESHANQKFNGTWTQESLGGATLQIGHAGQSMSHDLSPAGQILASYHSMDHSQLFKGLTTPFNASLFQQRSPVSSLPSQTQSINVMFYLKDKL